jgi:hypothetical protein
MGYRLDGWGLIPGRDKRFFSSLQCPGQFWGPCRLLYNGDWGLFPQDYSSQGMKLTTPLHLLPKSRMVELYFPLPDMSSWHVAI